jgi:hypothetical protein
MMVIKLSKKFRKQCVGGIVRASTARHAGRQKDKYWVGKGGITKRRGRK